MSEVCINFRRPNGTNEEVCASYEGEDAAGLTALQRRIETQAAALRANRDTLPQHVTVEFRTPRFVFGMRWPDVHSNEPTPAWSNNIVRLLSPPPANTQPPTPSSSPTTTPSTPPLAEGPRLTEADAPTLTPSSSVRDRLLSYVIRATTWADLRDTHDSTRRTNPQTGLFNLMYDEMSGGNHNPSFMSQYDVNSTNVQRWMRGEAAMPFTVASTERLNEIERFLDRAPDGPNTEREKVRVIRDPRLGTWLILGRGERVPAGYEVQEHTKLAVAFHNLRSLIEIVNTEPPAGQDPITQRLQTLMVNQCQRNQTDSRCTTVRTQEWGRPGTNANELDPREINHISEYTSFYGLQPVFTGTQHGWGQNAIKYTVQMLQVYNAFILYYNEARGS